MSKRNTKRQQKQQITQSATTANNQAVEAEMAKKELEETGKTTIKLKKDEIVEKAQEAAETEKDSKARVRIAMFKLAWWSFTSWIKSILEIKKPKQIKSKLLNGLLLVVIALVWCATMGVCIYGSIDIAASVQNPTWFYITGEIPFTAVTLTGLLICAIASVITVYGLRTFYESVKIKKS